MAVRIYWYEIKHMAEECIPVGACRGASADAAILFRHDGGCPLDRRPADALVENGAFFRYIAGAVCVWRDFLRA